MTGAPGAGPRAEVCAALRRAAAFVESAGDEIAIARAQALLGVRPVSAVVELLREAGREAPVDRLRSVLAILDDLRGSKTAAAERVCAALTARQGSDGSWRERERSSESERIVATGMIAGYLAKTPFVRQSTLASAADYLAARFDPDRVKGCAWEVNAAYSHCFALVRHERADAILQWCGRELERGFHSGVYDAVWTARVLVLCKARAMPGARLEAAELVERMLKEQADDGGYTPPGAGTPGVRVAHTLDALVGLERLA